ncbi:unnamed protein product [Adineta steineri]|uniref:Uncharacterized protein n=1 Tax=Adineta steineri TaxID=433720 RepID=A0A819XAX5_9BILA|nr:unnamed protein product [Adineta steineri]
MSSEGASILYQLLCLFFLITCIKSVFDQPTADQKKSSSKILSNENWLSNATDANTFLKARYSKQNGPNKWKHYHESGEYKESVDSSEEL